MMVRTKADGGSSAAGRKVVAASAPRKALGGSSSSSDPSSGKTGKYAGGNPVCPRPTPDWQKGINSFFQSPQKGKENQTPSDMESSKSSSQSSSSNPGPAVEDD
ncbi:PCNA-associated factor-like isoform X2 [Saccostrea echinata]|uniref:PCNA-associated factor-like isoform X2 n=1 Tax=Saccostrea echinata TaxID=191078 RepID=UPI002A8143AD|nr:PCNA-associated factor-like isoform X2 [Saccostrea echinata]